MRHEITPARRGLIDESNDSAHCVGASQVRSKVTWSVSYRFADCVQLDRCKEARQTSKVSGLRARRHRQDQAHIPL
jgi:hypothetical protein